MLHVNLLIYQNTLKHRDFWISFPNGKKLLYFHFCPGCSRKQKWYTLKPIALHSEIHHKDFVENILFLHLRGNFLISLLLTKLFFPENYLKYNRQGIAHGDNLIHKVFSHGLLLAIDQDHLLRDSTLQTPYITFSAHTFNETLICLG